MKHCNIHVNGKVQGVFFRASTKQKADELGVRGFVRNERDGSVYIEAEADKTTIDEFITWCRKGPAHAVVIEIEINEAPLQNFTTFEIQRW